MDWENYRKIGVVNKSGEAVPAYGVMQVNGFDLEDTAEIIKPDTDSGKLIIVNGPSMIPINGDGEGTIDMPWWVLFNASDGTPANNEQWGAKSGSWKLHKGKVGFLTIAMVNGIAPPMPGIVAVKWEECRVE